MTTPKSPEEIEAYIASLPPDAILTRECKHATYSVHRDGELRDMLSIKEWITLTDGTRWPRMRFVENYKRPYWLTKDFLRTHPDKIQFEDLARVDMHRIEQVKLRRDVCFRLGRGNPTNGLKQIARSPYVYGLDAGPEVFMKQNYLERYPGSFVPNNVTVIDAETDVNGMLHPTKQLPILWSLVSDDEIILYVNNGWAFDIPNYKEQVLAEYWSVIDEYINQIKKKLRNKKTGETPEFLDQIKKIPVSVEVLDTHFMITKGMVDRLHYTQPDLVTGWNVFFDANVIVNSIVEEGLDPADVLADPRVPYEFRTSYLREGPQTRMSASGREVRLEPQERWNVILNNASWRMQDAMQLYWQLRKAKGKESGGYGLEALSTRQLGVGKLKYPTEDTKVPPGTLHWHMDMQRQYKVRYGVYNIIDSLGVWIIDKKNNDLSSQISALAGSCDYSRFNSQPTINSIDMMFSIMKKRKKIICSTSDQMEDENDGLVTKKDGWIVTFPCHNVVDTGVYLFSDMPEVRSSIHMFGADADVETTYPTAEIIMNLSKETTVAEPCKIAGVGREAQRLASINITGGLVNSIEIMETICKTPTLDEWLDAFKQDMAA